MIKRVSYPFFTLNNVPVNNKTALILGQFTNSMKQNSSQMTRGWVVLKLTGTVRNSSQSNPRGLVQSCWDFFYDKLATQTTA